jgi:hypothetical protein
LVPSGGLAQENAGETFSPTQFGLDLLLPAFFTASRWPSLKSGEVSMNAACARASRAPQDAASAMARARMELRRSMGISLSFFKRSDCNLRGIESNATSP